MKKTLLLLLLVAATNVFGQAPFYQQFDWGGAQNYNLDSKSEYASHVLQHDLVGEFYFEGENLVEYFLEHLVIKLDSDEAIEDYNKVYLPFSNRSEIVVNKARVINTDGSTQMLDDSKVLISTDEQTGRKYKYFAFEGLTKGAVIDYYYVIKRNPIYKGKRLNFQSSSPKNIVNFSLYAPANLEFAFKSYNGLKEVQKQEGTEDRAHWALTVEDLDAIEEEEFSAYSASKKAIVYKLDKNTYNNKTGFASYKAIVKNLYPYYYKELTKEQKKLIADFISEMGLKSSDDLDTQVSVLERYVKTNVYLTEGASENLSDLEPILKNKVADEAGIIKLYAALFDQLNIKHELVFTSNRQDQKFDKDFEAHNFLTDVLFYVNETEKYLSPGESDSRYGFPPGYLTDNYGLFIKPIDLGGFKSGLGEVKYIDGVGADKTVDNMLIDVEFTDDQSANEISYSRDMAGYYAMYVQPYLHLANPDDKDNLLESFVKRLDENVDIKEKAFENESPEAFGREPLGVKIKFSSEAFIQRAGPKLLFKVGELIGEQTQLYQEKVRKLDVENEFNRTYERTINVKIPEGYRVTNLEDIVIDNAYQENGVEVVSFKSWYEQNGDTLIIRADEYYRENIMEKELFEEFRTVINSAADFNKVVLIIEPES